MVLGRDKRIQPIGARNPLGAGDLPTGEVRMSDVANRARGDEIVERPNRFFERGIGVGHMNLIEIDVIGA